MRQLKIGMTTDRLCELIQAEKENRILVDPPNDPLTLEELLEMDGEPVWITKNEQKGCAIVDAPCSIVYLTLGTGTHWDAEDLIAEGCKIYRRKPERRTR